MLATVWKFQVQKGHEAAFEELYGPGGLWAALFHESRAYHGTTLLRDPVHAGTYLLFDFWSTREDFEALKHGRAEAYEALDREGEKFTASEEHLGWFDDIER